MKIDAAVLLLRGCRGLCCANLFFSCSRSFRCRLNNFVLVRHQSKLDVKSSFSDAFACHAAEDLSAYKLLAIMGRLLCVWSSRSAAIWIWNFKSSHTWDQLSLIFTVCQVRRALVCQKIIFHRMICAPNESQNSKCKILSLGENVWWEKC